MNMNNEERRVEYAIDGLSNRHNFKSYNEENGIKLGDAECYRSHFIHTPEIIEYFNNTADEDGKHTIKGYSGAVGIDDFIIDIDNEDHLDKALDDTRIVVQHFIDEYDIDRSEIKVNFSGSKGFHIRLSSELFGGFETSEELPKIIKELAKTLVGDLAVIDTSIYNTTSLMRIVNTVNKKSGRVAIPLSVDELSAMTIEEISELSKEPRTIAATTEIVTPVDKLVEIKNKILSEGKSSSTVINFAATNKREAMWQADSSGNRHEGLLSLAGYLMHYDLPPKTILEICLLKNKINTPPKDETIVVKEVEGFIKSFSNFIEPFWTASKNNKGKVEVEINLYDYKMHLEKEGFAKKYLDRDYFFFNKKDGIVSISNETLIKDYIFELVDRTKMSDYYGRAIKNHLLEKNGKYFGTGLLECVRTDAFELKKDDNDNAFHFYKNGFVTINKNSGISFNDYSNFDGTIWETQIIDREFSISSNGTSVFEKFISNVCRNDPKRIDSVKSAIGYLIHGYKDASNAKAVVLVDEKISHDGEPNGRSGKSLFGKALVK